MFTRTRSNGSKFGRTSSTRNGFRSASTSGSYFRSRPATNGRSNFSASRRGRGENIDINKFIQKSVVATVENTTEITNKFSDFDLSMIIKDNLRKRNFETPTPIQDQAIEPIIAGHDIIGLANTGTGKTAAFLLPLIDKAYKNRQEKVLIVAPTRELALQIDNEFRQFSWGMQLFSATCVGGAPIHKQINNLKRNPNFVIGTPGRLKDLAERGLIKFENFRSVVLDEVDRMLDMGFIDEIKTMISQMPAERQTLFFSATMPEKIRGLAAQFLKSPVTVSVSQGQTAKNVDQDVVRVRDHAMKFEQLQEILKGDEMKKVLIFSETKRDVEKLTNNLQGEGFKADSIHGDKKQSQRVRSLTSFRDNRVNILVATDVAARGLDIKDVTHVINYTVPQTYDDYIHRIGRTGRAGKKGFALTFVEAR